MIDLVRAGQERLMKVGSRLDVRGDAQTVLVRPPHNVREQRRVQSLPTELRRVVFALRELFGILQVGFDKVGLPDSDDWPLPVEVGEVINDKIKCALAVFRLEASLRRHDLYRVAAGGRQAAI